MFARLVQKEFLHYLLDFRFIAIFAFCVSLSILSVYVGIERYMRQLEHYNAVSEFNRRFLQNSVKKGHLTDIMMYGYSWNWRPEALSPVVFGLSGELGQEVHIQYRQLMLLNDSFFSVDPVHMLFGVIDFAFLVKYIFSLCLLLLTYDAICGEKEAGTLRLYVSFPVSRSMLVMAKPVGSGTAVLIPFILSFLLVCLVLVFFSALELKDDDWARMATLMGIFTLYLGVFAVFGLWISALSHRRVTAFLGLLGLWVAWLFVVPDVATQIARHQAPVKGIYDLERQYTALRWEVKEEQEKALDDFRRKNPIENPEGLSDLQKQERWNIERSIREKWDTAFNVRLGAAKGERQNQLRRQQRLVMVLSSVSPLGAVSFASVDLARTGLFQRERLERALSDYRIYVSRYIRDKIYQAGGEVPYQMDLADFSWFVYQDRETVGTCLARNLFQILNLALLIILGFAGAYTKLLRYDVR